jgi:hypothetical protein
LSEVEWISTRAGVCRALPLLNSIGEGLLGALMEEHHVVEGSLQEQGGARR